MAYSHCFDLLDERFDSISGVMNHPLVSVQDRRRGAIIGAQPLPLVGSPVIQPCIICSGHPPGFFPSSVSALQASRILLCTATGAFDPGRGCSSPPGLEPSAIQIDNWQRRAAN